MTTVRAAFSLALLAVVHSSAAIAQSTYRHVVFGSWLYLVDEADRSFPLLTVANSDGLIARLACAPISTQERNPTVMNARNAPKFSCLLFSCATRDGQRNVALLYNTTPHARETATPPGSISLFATLLPGGAEQNWLENARELGRDGGASMTIDVLLQNVAPHVPGEPVQVLISIYVSADVIDGFAQYDKLRFRIPPNGPVVEEKSRFYDPERHPADAGRDDIEFDLKGLKEAIAELDAESRRRGAPARK